MGASPDVVINAAAYTAVDDAEEESDRAFRVNSTAAGEVAAAAARVGVPVVQISTDYVFDGRAEQPYTEDASTAPINIYGRSKLEGEQQVRSANPKHAIVRTSWVYSPFGRNFVRTMMGAAETRDELKVVDDQRGSPSSAFDLAEGLLRMIQAGGAASGKTYHLAGTGWTTWFGFAREIMEERRHCGLRTAQVEAVTSDEWPTKARRPRNSVLNSTKFLSDFGYQMPEWRSSLRAVIRRLAEHR
jgi:dTDP-4-dehydrorhamnose reductase